ncbi:hypothetical protein [Methanosaeta sp. UBA458]|jgi:hypothetical protein|uniref:hypothetical protein n=1 Tax=Methanosaeta sp. UBA458 TaxID=1915561 RepID=UPI00257D76B7|nr:hypothetical protein [Methanosaeta sp. UBA458]
MSIFDEPIMIDGNAIELYEPPGQDNLIDLEKLCPWLRGPTPEEEERARMLRAESLLIEMREESRVYYNR